ncbi:MAG: phosphatase PAP2 family protein [Rhizomicrobium sp.]
MNLAASRILFGLPLGLAAADAAWGLAGRFDIDWNGYVAIAALSLALLGLGHFYKSRRPDPNLSAMLFGASFLCAFSSVADLLNYLLLTVAGRDIDPLLAHADRMVDFNWPQAVAFAAAHPVLNTILRVAYMSALPQVAVLIAALGLLRQPGKIYGFCIALGAGAVIAIGFWTLFPSFGAFAIYHLPATLAAKADAALDGNYARDLVSLLRHGPGRIDPWQVKGLIGFPSFHTVMALLTAWYARNLPGLRWIALGLNILVIVAAPIHGGHHLIDLLGGVLTAAVAVYFSHRVLDGKRSARARPFAGLGQTTAFPSV